VEADTARLEGAIPDAGETVSHDELEDGTEAVHESVPFPLFEI
jgi:hypothetical protein